ncbi:MAG: amidohydrolase family protein [Rhodobacteraceae bacterium]|nr:amidohydrolase family protein [Paracoccaceae bacterium]
MRIRFENCDLFEGTGDALLPGVHVLVADGRVAEVAPGAIAGAAERVIDATGLTLMPGLIDAHVHVSAASPNLGALEAMSPAWVAHWTARHLAQMLERGFTTVRDMGGGEAGTKWAQAEGLIRGPRLLTCGKAIGQTGGHTDYRGRSRTDMGEIHRRHAPGIGRIADGVAEVLAAARDELRLGNDFVKIMANGGVASPTDPIDWIQFTAEEIGAAVAAAEAACTYVAAHTYTARAIEHAARNGVRTLEHCNLVDDRVAALVAARGAFAVPTLVAYDALERHADAIGLGPANREKNRTVRAAGLASLEILARAGVPTGFGTDLLGWMGADQLAEFAIRARVLPAAAVLRSATSVNARILGRPDLGRVVPGATADLILVAGDPLADPGGCLAGQGERIPLVLQEGRVVKDRLAA